MKRGNAPMRLRLSKTLGPCTIAVLLALSLAGLTATAQTTKPGDPPVATPPTAPVSPPVVAPAPTPPTPRRVHVIIDRKSETGGTVVYEDETRIVIERDGKRSEFNKDDIIDAIALVEIAEPTMVVVYRRDGGSQQVKLIADDFDEVRYVIGTATRSIPRAEVYRVALMRTFEERYQALKQSIEPDDDARRLALCDWLVTERKYAEARLELVELVAKTKLSEAVALLKHVDAQLALLKARVSSKSSTTSGTSTTDPKGASVSAPATRVLTDAEVNLIRVYELDFDNPPRVIVDHADARALLEEYGSSPRVPTDAPSRSALAQGDPLTIVRLAFELKARDFYPKIRVVTEPATLVSFRRNVHDGWLIANCATSRCHGGPDAGKFFLFGDGRNDVRMRYTNLLNLLRGSSQDRPIVDFTDPMQSILIQHALPLDESSNPHPTVEGWRPVFGRKLNPDKLANTLAWIRSMYQPRPIYPIEYEPPDLRGEPVPTRPATPDAPSR